MPGLIESASGILVSSERRVEASAQNVANAPTAGFKRQIAFSELLARTSVDAADTAAVRLRFASDLAQGKLRETRKPLDLAIFGPGFFKLRDGAGFVYTRGGSFSRDADGAVIDAAGRVLQQAGGGDLLVDSEAPQILGDGSVVENGLPTATLALFEPASGRQLASLGGGLFDAPDTAMLEASGSVVRQGQLESANVTMSDEMIALMATARQAEGGARLVQAYDQLIGQAITTFSRSGK
jgi:flagellar basal body rod protein FlgG